MLRTIVLAATALGAFSGTAIAADVRVAGEDTVVYTAGAGEANVVVVSVFEETKVRITDAGARIEPGARCRSVGPADVICEPPPAPPAEEDDLPPYAAL